MLPSNEVNFNEYKYSTTKIFPFLKLNEISESFYDWGPHILNVHTFLLFSIPNQRDKSLQILENLYIKQTDSANLQK